MQNTWDLMMSLSYHNLSAEEKKCWRKPTRSPVPLPTPLELKNLLCIASATPEQILDYQLNGCRSMFRAKRSADRSGS